MKKKITFISCFLLLVFFAMSSLRGDGGFASVHSGWVQPWDVLPGGVWACCELCFAGSCSQALHWGQLFTVAPAKGLSCRSRSRPAPLCHGTTGIPTTAEKWDLSYTFILKRYTRCSTISVTPVFLLAIFVPYAVGMEAQAQASLNPLAPEPAHEPEPLCPSWSGSCEQ